MKERDCANCKHHTEDGCSSWDCEFEAKDLISRADAIETVLTYFIPRSHTGERGEHEEDFVRTIFNALPSADAEPKWNCTANFMAEQLDRLKNMTDEEKWEFFKRFFEMKGGDTE